MSNDETRKRSGGVRHSGLVILSSFGIRHSSFCNSRGPRIGPLRRFGPASRQIAHDLDILEDAALPRAMLLHPFGHGGDAFFEAGFAPIAEGVIAFAVIGERDFHFVSRIEMPY